MQFQADLLGVPVVRPAVTETTALGAAYLAGLAVGFWQSVDEITGQWQVDRRFEPAMPRGGGGALRERWTGGAGAVEGVGAADAVPGRLVRGPSVRRGPVLFAFGRPGLTAVGASARVDPAFDEIGNARRESAIDARREGTDVGLAHTEVVEESIPRTLHVGSRLTRMRKANSGVWLSVTFPAL